MDYDNLLQLEDATGPAFVIANVGEVEEDLAALYTLVPPVAMQPVGLTFPFNTCWAPADNALRARLERYLAQTYWLNYIQLYYVSDKFRGQAQSAAALAFLRMMLVREGLANPDTDPAANNCQYNLCRRAEGVEEYLFGTTEWYETVRIEAARAHPAGFNAAQFRALYSGGRGTNINNLRPIQYRNKPMLTVEDKELLRCQFTDIVCLVAFMFRTRAHHWTVDMDPTYRRLWKGCVKSGGREAPLCDWEACGRYLCKTPFPLQLDAYWRKSIDEAKCSAKLAIRWDAPAAGTAGLVAVRRGYDDLRTAFPVITEKLQGAITALVDQETKINGDRWGPSINSKYYGVPANRVDERGLAPLAATVLAALQQFVDNSPLAKSKALERLAQSAPIVGSVIAAILSKVSTHESVVYSYIPQDIRAIAFR